MSHYDTLGVGRDASEEDIKKAYRRKASKAHPDRGGNSKEMQDLNRAYETLGDAAKRLNYDKTGQDDHGDSRQQRVNLELMTIFNTVIATASRDLVGAASVILSQRRQQLSLALSERQSAKKFITLRAKLVRIKKRSERNDLFKMVIDSRLKELEQSIAQVEQEIEFVKDITRALDDYESNDEEPAQTARPSLWTPLIGGR